METFTLSRKELHRPGLVKAACAGRITTRQAAQALGLSLRQTRRLKRRFETEGAAGLPHRSRGRPSQRRLPRATREEVIRLILGTDPKSETRGVGQPRV
jgi:transposase